MISAAAIVSFIVFVCVFGGALVGISLSALIPQQHLDGESKDVVRGGMAVVATMVALVLGLLIASAKGFFDTQTNELTQMSADVVLVDRMLAHYGPGSAPARAILKAQVVKVLSDMWSRSPSQTPVNPGTERAEPLYDSVEGLAPKTDDQRTAKAQALEVLVEMGRLRWLMYAQRSTHVPNALIGALAIWLVLVSLTSGLFTRPNATVIASFFLSALAVASAMWLILEMYAPYSGWIRVSDAALRAALAQLGT